MCWVLCDGSCVLTERVESEASLQGTAQLRELHRVVAEQRAELGRCRSEAADSRNQLLRLEELARSMEPGAQVSGRSALAGGVGSEHGAWSAGQWASGFRLEELARSMVRSTLFVFYQLDLIRTDDKIP